MKLKDLNTNLTDVEFRHTHLYDIYKVRYGIEDQNSNTYLLDASQKSMVRFASENRANQPFLGVIQSEKDFSNIIELCGHTLDEVEQLLERKALEKWIFPQGGVFTKEQCCLNLPNYFNTVHVSQEPDQEDLFIGDLLHELTYKGFDIDELFETNPRALYNQYKGDHRSSGGLTYLGDRRSPGVARLAIAQAMGNLYMFDLAIAGMRLKDNKYRNIFMDSFANYFREAYFLSRVFRIWHAMPFDSNQGDIRLAKKILKYQAAESYGGDYKAMDQHHGYDATVRALWVIQRWLGINTKQLSQLIFWFKDLFEQGVLVGDEMWIPTDFVNFLSGLYPTHDLEGMVNVIILSETCVSYGLKIQVRNKRLKKDEVAIIVCGDDSIVLFGGEMPADFPQRHASYAAKYGQVVDLDSGKIEHSTTTASFCKKHYALREDVPGFQMAHYEDFDYRIPKYSIRKAVNSVYHPENMPDFPNYHDLLIWFAMIFDNVAGNKLYKAIVKVIVDKNPKLFCRENLNQVLDYGILMPEEVRAELCKDWWTSKVWDAGFLTKSPTLKLLNVLIK